MLIRQFRSRHGCNLEPSNPTLLSRLVLELSTWSGCSSSSMLVACRPTWRGGRMTSSKSASVTCLRERAEIVAPWLGKRGSLCLGDSDSDSASLALRTPRATLFSWTTLSLLLTPMSGITSSTVAFCPAHWLTGRVSWSRTIWTSSRMRISSSSWIGMTPMKGE